MGRAIHLPSHCVFTACYRVTFTFRGLHLMNLGKVSLEDNGGAGRVKLRQILSGKNSPESFLLVDCGSISDDYLYAFFLVSLS
jgi:hypothetical protein